MNEYESWDAVISLGRLDDLVVDVVDSVFCGHSVSLPHVLVVTQHCVASRKGIPRETERASPLTEDVQQKRV